MVKQQNKNTNQTYQLENSMTWLLIGILIGMFIRCLNSPYKSEEDKFKDPWNWTGFGGG